MAAVVENKIHTSVTYHLPRYTVGHTDGASTVEKNAPERDLDKFIRRLKIIHVMETHRASDIKGQVIIQQVIERN